MMSNYPLWRQRSIPIACCVLHNFIRGEAMRDKEFQMENLDVVDQEGVGDNQQVPDIDMS